MKLRFTKMHGLGNDFIVIDCRTKRIKDLPGVIKKLAPRRFSVGFDQALVLKNSERADFGMEIYNADGTKVEMCGNGIRCLARYIWKKRLSRKRTLAIETLAGIIRPQMAGELVCVDMGQPILDGKLIPTKEKGIIVDHPLKIDKKKFLVTCVSMGNPHCIIFTPDVESFPVEQYGPLIERDPFFPRRTNVEFIEVVNRRRLKMRVWERGAAETLACGTGASAAAVASNLKGHTTKRVSVELRGGELSIELTPTNHVLMTGPAVEVFEGTAEV